MFPGFYMHEYDALISGATGFIGHRLLKTFLDEGRGVVAVSRCAVDTDVEEPVGQKLAVRWDLEESPPSFPRCRTWFHLAANTDIAFCNRDPERAMQINAHSLSNALVSAEAADCEVFVLVSTLGVYGEPNYLPTDEEHPKQPIEAYARSKAMAEDLLLDFRSVNFRRVIARPFNTFGPGQKGHMLVPMLLAQAEKREVVEVRNVDCTRDFIYVDDVVRGLRLCAEKAGDGDIVNLGSGIERSVMDIIRAIEEVFEKKLDVHVDEQDAVHTVVRRSQADISKAQTMLGWSPEVSLVEGIGRTAGGTTN